jgi:3',5'-cyclic AMP phosphodiesterase CpdA
MLTNQLISRVCSTERPDLVVITGDIVSGAFTRSGFKTYYLQVADVMEQLKIPFVWIPGPSDFESADATVFSSVAGTSKMDMTGYNKFKW